MTGQIACARRISSAPTADSPQLRIFPSSDQLLHGGGDLFDRGVRVLPVLVVQVDVVGAQPGQAGLHRRADGRGAAVGGHAGVGEAHTELGGDHHIAADRLQRLTDQLLVVGDGAVGADAGVALSGVEEGVADLPCCPDDLNRLARLRGRTVRVRQAMQPIPTADTSSPNAPSSRVFTSITPLRCESVGRRAELAPTSPPSAAVRE